MTKKINQNKKSNNIENEIIRNKDLYNQIIISERNLKKGKIKEFNY